MIIDIHLHLTHQNHFSTDFASARDMIPYLKQLSIEKGILLSNGEDTPLLSNQECYLIAQEFPEIFYWMCNLDEKEQDTIFQRLSTYKKMGAIGIGELMVNRRLSHPFLQEIFRCAEELSLPVLFHMSPQEGFQYGVVDDAGLPLLETILQKYPHLILIGHSQPFWIEIEKNPGTSIEERNAWGSGKISAPGRVVELLRRYPNLYCDLSANSGSCAILRDEDFGISFIQEFQDRLLFGTDMYQVGMSFPFLSWFQQKVNDGVFSQNIYEKITYQNAFRIFQLGGMNEN